MNSKKTLAALCGILCLTLAGGTFAYFTQTDDIKNIFHTGTYATEIVEDFHPEDGVNWNPGVTVNKDVSVKNTGSLPVAVRVRFEEQWTRPGTEEVIYHADSSSPDPVLGPGPANNKFESVFQSSPTDGDIGEDVDDSVVIKSMHLGVEDGEGWIYNPEDGWYYYSRVLDGLTEGAEPDQTRDILDAVTLAEDADMGKFFIARYYSDLDEMPQSDDGWKRFATTSDPESPDGWRYLSTREMSKLLAEAGENPIRHMKAVTEFPEPPIYGYSNADYSLTVTAQTVQATKGAVANVFGLEDLSGLYELGCDWDLADDDSVFLGDREAR